MPAVRALVTACVGLAVAFVYSARAVAQSSATPGSLAAAAGFSANHRVEDRWVHEQWGDARWGDARWGDAQWGDAQWGDDRCDTKLSLFYALGGSEFGDGPFDAAAEGKAQALLATITGVAVGSSLSQISRYRHGQRLLATSVRGLGIGIVALRGFDSLGVRRRGAAYEFIAGGAIHDPAEAPLLAKLIGEVDRRRLIVAPAPVVGPQFSVGFGMSVSGSF